MLIAQWALLTLERAHNVCHTFKSSPWIWYVSHVIRSFVFRLTLIWFNVKFKFSFVSVGTSYWRLHMCNDMVATNKCVTVTDSKSPVLISACSNIPALCMFRSYFWPKLKYWIWASSEFYFWTQQVATKWYRNLRHFWAPHMYDSDSFVFYSKLSLLPKGINSS